jgi:hypothetical protein
VGSFVAAYGHFFMAADTRQRRTDPAESSHLASDASIVDDGPWCAWAVDWPVAKTCACRPRLARRG